MLPPEISLLNECGIVPNTEMDEETFIKKGWERLRYLKSYRFHLSESLIVGGTISGYPVQPSELELVLRDGEKKSIPKLGISTNIFNQIIMEDEIYQKIREHKSWDEDGYGAQAHCKQTDSVQTFIAILTFSTVFHRMGIYHFHIGQT